jgi:hypothetical protein
MDPLSAAEIAKVLSKSAQNTTMRSSSSTDSATDDQIDERETSQTTLLIERHQGKNKQGNAPRLADIFIYDYSVDQLIQRVVNLDNNTIISSTVSQGYQLPLIADEVDRAVRIAFADPAERALLNQEYQRITGNQLVDASSLDYKAFVFYGDSLPGKVNSASLQCGVHRCAQLLFYTKQNVTFDFSPIINLSLNSVTQNVGF